MIMTTMTINKVWFDTLLTHCQITKDMVRGGKMVDAYFQLEEIIAMIKEKTKQEDGEDDQCILGRTVPPCGSV